MKAEEQFEFRDADEKYFAHGRTTDCYQDRFEFKKGKIARN